MFEAAPEFELGTIPAGNLYTTANDLARFAVFVMGGESAGQSGPVLRRDAGKDVPAAIDRGADRLRPRLSGQPLP